MNGRQLINKIAIGVWLTASLALVHAGTPVWTFTPLTTTTLSVANNNTATVSYQITNQSRRSHTLVMKDIPGVTQVTTAGNCPNPFVLDFLQSCVLNLAVNGSTLTGNVLSGPIVCQEGNPNQCYQPSLANSLNITKLTAPGETTLSISPANLALSVTGLTEYGVSGTPSSGHEREITISNTGSHTAVNLSIASPTWPAGTSSSTSCGSTLAAGSSCTVTVQPGLTATSDGTNPCSSGTAPVPGAVQVTADNASTVSTNVVVLSYGCIYQGGYVYALDDTTPYNGSVGGKVATTSDQAAPFPNGIVWSSNGGTGNGSGGNDPIDASFDILPGIDETSTSATGSPTYAIFASFFSTTYTNSLLPLTSASFSMCDGRLNGSCNTDNIWTFYNQFITNNTLANFGTGPFTASPGPTDITYYAAGLCKQTIDNYSDWYLPAICEMGYGSGSSACGSSLAPVLQNIQSSLLNISGLSSPSGFYWSSTQISFFQLDAVWGEFFAPNLAFSNQPIFGKSQQLGVRCSRNLIL